METEAIHNTFSLAFIILAFAISKYYKNTVAVKLDQLLSLINFTVSKQLLGATLQTPRYKIVQSTHFNIDQ